VRAKLERDLEELGAFADTVLDRARLDEVSELAHRYLLGRSALLEDRVAGGLVVDGHGDLLAGDIFCLTDGPRILDCIEFDDRLRHGDVLADVAFLAMDLERLGAPDLAGLLIAAYEEFSGEHHPQTLADYYVAARALIRSKVACIRSVDDGAASTTEARSLLDLAVDHLRRAQVRLVLVGGEPGTGKSTLAEGIADRLDFVVLRSDAMRKELLGLHHGARAEAAYGEGAYDAATTDATYGGLLDRARAALSLGESVILDASWSEASRRTAAARVAEDACADLVELRCEAPVEVSVRRINERRARGTDHSDATPEIAAAMRAVFDPWPTASLVSTGGSAQESLAAALRALGA
jgi:predicted kinase